MERQTEAIMLRIRTTRNIARPEKLPPDRVCRQSSLKQRSAKEPLNIDKIMSRLRPAVEPFPPAAMFALKDAGFSSLFQQLVGCIISIRTRDEVSLPTSLALLKKAATAQEMLTLSENEIDDVIHVATFHRPKPHTICPAPLK